MKVSNKDIWGNEVKILKKLSEHDLLSSSELLKSTMLNQKDYDNSIKILKTKKQIEQTIIYSDIEVFFNSELAYKITGEGLTFLKENSKPLKIEIANPQDIAPELKEIASYLMKLTVNQKEMLKLLIDKNEILDEILFLKNDEITLMKIEFEKLLKKESSASFPWETFNSVLSIISMLATIKNQ